MMLSILSCASCSFVYFFWRNVCLCPLPIFKWIDLVCLFTIELYEFLLCFLNINPLSDILFVNISPYQWFFSAMLMISFDVQKLFSLKWSPLLIFALFLLLIK